MRIVRLLCSALLATSALHVPAQFYLHDNDRVVFYGDSITDQQKYTNVIETYVVTRYPGLHIHFTNSGWGGDRVSGGGGGNADVRLSRDLFPYKPTVVTIMLGMNDGGYKAPTVESDQQYFRGYEHLVSAIEANDPKTRLTLIEPSPYDDVTRPPAFPVSNSYPYNNALIGFARWTENYAAGKPITLADANTDFVRMLQRASAQDPKVANDILPDHVHPSFGGALMIAEAVLKAWHADPLVASVNIDAGSAKPKVTATHAKVTDLRMENGLHWTELDAGLPLPFVQWQTMWGGGPTVGLTVQSSDLMSALNQEPLQVSGLKRGVYRLTIDEQEIGTFNNTELAQGINLATLKTPMTEQAMSVYQTLTEHVDLHYARWRHIEVPLTGVSSELKSKTMQDLDSLEEEVSAQERQQAQPKAHAFSLTPVV